MTKGSVGFLFTILKFLYELHVYTITLSNSFLVHNFSAQVGSLRSESFDKIFRCPRYLQPVTYLKLPQVSNTRVSASSSNKFETPMSQTKIPSISGRKRASLPLESTAKESYKKLHALEDVTNKNIAKVTQSRMPKVADPNARLMHRYYYGDVRVIEEVKKRERKIVRDIQHFRRSIAEIDSETKLIKERNLPDVKYNISKKAAICDELRKELLQVTADLDEKNGECELVAVNGDLTMKNLQLQHKVELQNAQNELDKELSDARASWEIKLREMENFKPDVQTVNEIEELKEKKQDREKAIEKLELQNKQKCKEYEVQLDELLKDFIKEKEEPLKEIQEKHDSLQATYSHLKSVAQKMSHETTMCKDECESTSKQIEEIKKKLKEVEKENTKLREILLKVQHEYYGKKNITDKVQEKAHAAEMHYNTQFDMMEHEQMRRRKLENSIDELRGKVRCFAYVGENLGNNYAVDYSSKIITTDTESAYCFTRVIPRSLVTEQDLFKQECQAYIEMCMNKSFNFNIVSLLNDNPNKLRDSFVDFMANQTYSHMELQYVSLCERLASADMLLTPAEESDKEIKVKIEENSIELNSKSVIVRSPAEIQDFLRLTEEQTRPAGIGMLKLKVWIEENKAIDVYFVEINDRKTTEYLLSIISPGEVVQTPVTIILQNLLTKTKSLFLFNLLEGTDQHLPFLLDLANRIGQLDSPRKNAVRQR